jgi:RNA polymerase sigma-70 factor (ECF subfamily)
MRGDDSRLPLEAYRDYLRTLARIQLGGTLRGKIEPSDIVQETMLRAHQRQHQYRGQTRAGYTAWLRQILAHQLANAIRRFGTEMREASRERSLEAALQDSSDRLEKWLVADSPGPEQRIARQEDLLRLAHLLAELPEHQRVAVEMKHLQGHSLEDIAARLGRTKAAAASIFYRGIVRLRERMGAEERDGHEPRA